MPPVKILVVAETKNGAVRKTTLETLAEARRLVAEAGGAVGAALIGPAGADEAERLAQHGADVVFRAEGTALERYILADGLR